MQTQLQIMASGGKIIQLSENLLEHTAQQFENDAKVIGKGRVMAILLQMLDRVNPGYAA